jgi:putative transposase
LAIRKLEFKEKELDKPLLLFFQDEGRFGRINNIQRCWCPHKTRAKVGKQFVREYIYAYTAVCPENGSSFSLVIPDADTESMNIFLSEFSGEYKNNRIILAMDRAGWHRSEELKVPDNIHLLFIPSNSPELNPVEHIWDYIRENFFNNRVFKSLDTVMDKLCFALKHLYGEKEKVKSMTLFEWIYYAL